MIHTTTIRPRFCETDALGHINNVSYFIYFEQARVEFFIDSQIEKNLEGWSFVLASAHCDFRKQAYLHQSLMVMTTVSHIGRSSVKLKHRMIDQSTEEFIAEGEDVLVRVNLTTQKSEPLTEDMITILKNYFANEH
ncbi:MAG TPA: thioesterase family protein [Bacillota bacterium]|nr:thioesterase family protein [Bacillota bacterium]